MQKNVSDDTVSPVVLSKVMRVRSNAQSEPKYQGKQSQHGAALIEVGVRPSGYGLRRRSW